MQPIIDTLSLPENIIFSIALGLFVFVLFLQLTGLGEVLGIADIDGLGTNGTPLMIFLAPFLVSFSCIGLVCNRLLNEMIVNSPDTFMVSTGTRVSLVAIFSIVSSFFIASQIGKLITAWLPTAESYGIESENLAGLTGKIVSGKIDESGSFYISVKHPKNGTIKLKAIGTASESQLPRGQAIVIVAYDQPSDICKVDILK